MLEDKSEGEDYSIVTKHGVWNSSSEEDEIKSPPIPPQKELNFFGFKFDLEIVKNNGFQNPKFAVYLLQLFSLISLSLIVFFYGYVTNWDVLAYAPPLVGWTLALATIFIEFNQSCEFEQTTTQKTILATIKLIASILYCFSIIYVLLFNVPFRNPTIYLTAIYPLFLMQCFLFCLAAKYNKQRTTQIIYNKNQTRNKIIRIKNNDTDDRKKTVWLDKCKIYGKRLWEGMVLSVMYIDVLSDIYCGFVLFQIYGALSTFLRVSGIMLMACCAADLMLVIFMLIFPGRVNHFAHTIAFAMEVPNFVLTGISIWKIRQLIFQNQIENLEGQQLAIFSVVTTSVNALIHVVYIVDSWAVKSAVEFVQMQHG